ncbi:MAG: aldo/keto reductase [Sedimentisphaerales bacterium]|nr:aldo/keto reductase [Sedimentisphaerales bacterium]
MSDELNRLNRRDFLKTAGGAGLVSLLGSAAAFADPNAPKTQEPNAPAKLEQVPRRKLGKTGVMVPILNLGGGDFMENQIMLRRAIDWGVSYWDTADCYANGNSELGIGKYLDRNPGSRKNIFIVTKSCKKDSVSLQGMLERSLGRMKTDYVDLFFLHGVGNPSELTDDAKNWAQKAKQEKKIKFFGFSTHSEMAKCLDAAAKVDWIDAIMTTYNFREMQNPEMQAAMDACHKANIGLVAMKTQAKGPSTEGDKKLVGHFMEKGFTEHQAKLKAVWQDERIASICSAIPNVAILVSNVAASLDKTKLTQADMDVLKEYAAATCNGYCAGCASICGAAMPEAPIRDVMRFVMYHDSYGSRQLAKEHFAGLDAGVRAKIASLDYTSAEQTCPQKLPIGRLMREAVNKLA